MTLRMTWLALCAAAPLAAQQPLTLDQAIGRAWERGHQARAARAARDAARYEHQSFRARLLPQLSLQGTLPAYNRSIIPVLQPDGSTIFRSQQQTSATVTMTLSQKLPFTGGDLFVSSSLARLDVTGQQTFETWSSTPVSVGLRQDLFRPNLAGWDRREDAQRIELEERAFLEAMEDIGLRTAGAFFNAYAARLSRDNAATNAAVNDTLYRLNRARFEVGRIGENDLLQSELALLRSRTAFQAAELEAARTSEALRLALDLPVGTPIEVQVTTDVPAEIAVDTARAVTEALRNRAALSAVALVGLQADRGVAQAKLGNGVGATVQASYGLNAIAPVASQVYQDLLEARRFTLSIELPLWQWGARGDGVRAAEANRERVARLGEASVAQVAHEARFAALELDQARRNLALVAKADSVAAKRFEVAYNRYVIGRITIDNLYIAQAEKDQARVQYADAQRRYWSAYYGLRRATLYDFAAGRVISR